LKKLKESAYIFMYAEATDKDLIHIRLHRGRREEVGRGTTEVAG
jgi:hypothetical protein